jgi:hypothetical protein
MTLQNAIDDAMTVRSYLHILLEVGINVPIEILAAADRTVDQTEAGASYKEDEGRCR